MANKSSTGLNENVASTLCYVLGWITGLVFFLLEKDNKTIKFHALQSMITFGATFVLNIMIGILMAVFTVIHLSIFVPILVLLNTLVGLATFVLWIILMIKAYQGEKIKLPLAGDIAENYL